MDLHLNIVQIFIHLRTVKRRLLTVSAKIVGAPYVRYTTLAEFLDLGVLSRTVVHVEGSAASNIYARRILEKAHYKAVE